MRLAILSRGPHLYSTRRLHEAAIGCGHHVHVLNTMAFSVVIDGDASRLIYADGRSELPRYAAVIPRIGASITEFGCTVVQQFESIGTFAINGAVAIRSSRDKLRAAQLLCAASLPVPTTILVRSASQVAAAFAAVDGPPVVIKVAEGTQGNGVMLAPDVATTEAVVSTLQDSGHRLIIQRFVSESRGRDVRALVVGGEVVASMRRIAVAGEFRANLHRGGRVEAITLDPDSRQVAIQAAQVLGLNVAGVDMLEGRDGPLVLEVNSSPGLEGIESATGVDAAAEIINYLSRRLSENE